MPLDVELERLVPFEAEGENFIEPWAGWVGWLGSRVAIAWVCEEADMVGARVVSGVEIGDLEREPPFLGELARAVVDAIVGWIDE